MKPLYLLSAVLACACAPAFAQDLNLGGAPGAAPVPIHITASQGITWSQDAQTVTANGDAKAVRGDVTVTADELVAHYMKKPGTGGQPAASGSANSASPLDQGNAQLTELDAIGHVHIYTATDNAWGDQAVYSVGQQVLVLTGHHLKLTTSQDIVTARDSIEYYAAGHKAIARGDALIVAKGGRSIAADVITGYFESQTGDSTQAQNAAQNEGGVSQSGHLKRVEALGHVVIKTTTDTATGDRGIYLPPTGEARLGGNVHIIHGQNELAGSDALVNMKTGIATLLAGPGGQVSGVILPVSGNAK
ncbi:MAG: organic solvent tolerance protein OstA [Rhodospirillales bacterium]|nr:organic solvent tolerance protein OstA [Rhodospirillales bacterium]